MVAITDTNITFSFTFYVCVVLYKLIAQPRYFYFRISPKHIRNVATTLLSSKGLKAALQTQVVWASKTIYESVLFGLNET